MAGKSKTRVKLEAAAEEAGIAFDDETTSKALTEALKAAKDKAARDTPPEQAVGTGQTQAAAPVAPAIQPEPGAEGALIVTGPKKGRWRAGRHFTPEETIILVSDLDAGQREMIEGDPALSVEFLPPET